VDPQPVPEVTVPELTEPDAELPQTYLQSVTTAEALKDWNFEPGELKESYILGVKPTGGHGESLPPEELARRIADKLADVESNADEEGDLDPAGWTVAVNVTLEGLEGVPLLLTWSLEGVDIPGSWATETVAYRVTASTPRDVGSAEIWIPHLKTTNEYNVVARLRLASDSTKTLASGRPLAITIPG